jgi:hypothetical protein
MAIGLAQTFTQGSNAEKGLRLEFGHFSGWVPRCEPAVTTVLYQGMALAVPRQGLN